jgi:hypothetical protein
LKTITSEVDVLKVEDDKEPDTGNHEVILSQGTNAKQKDRSSQIIMSAVSLPACCLFVIWPGVPMSAAYKLAK